MNYKPNGVADPLAIAQPNPLEQLLNAPQMNSQGQGQQPLFVPLAQQVAQQQPQQPAAPAAAQQQPIVPEPTQLVPVQSAPQQKPATIAELEQNCPGAPSDFVVQMLKANATVQQAQAAFIQYQNMVLANRSTQQQGQAPVAAPQPQPQPQYVPQQVQTPVAQQAVAALQPQQVAQPAAPAMQLPGNAPMQLEPLQPQQNWDENNARQRWDQLVKQERDMLISAGVNPAQAAQRAVSNVHVQNPGLKQTAFGVTDVFQGYTSQTGR